MAFDHAGKKGIWTSRLNFFGAGAATTFTVGLATLVAEQGNDLGFGMITALSMHDPINNQDRGNVTFWVTSANGTQAIVRAQPREVIFLDFDPVTNFRLRAFPQTTPLFSIVGNRAPGWGGTMADTFAQAAPGRADLNGGGAVATIQNNVVSLVQSMFDDLDPVAGGSQGVRVRVLGRTGDAPPADGPVLRVFIGDGPYSERPGNANSTAGVAPIDLFNQGAARDCEPFTDTNGNGQFDPGEPFADTNGDGVNNCERVFAKGPIVVFVDNIFRKSSGYFTDAIGNPVGLDEMGASRIAILDVERAVASTIAHEVGHALGLRHLDNSLNRLIMDRNIDINELRSLQTFVIMSPSS